MLKEKERENVLKDNNSKSCGCEYTHKEHKEIDECKDSCIYTLENLGCAHCAAKMEKKIQELPNVTEATITFSTKQLRLKAKDKEVLLPEIQKICESIESEVKVVPKEKRNNKTKEKLDHSLEMKKEFIELIIGIGFFALGKFLEETKPEWSLLMFVISYLLLGRSILLSAVKNLIKGQVLDENFLMSVATLGAFIIKDYPEAVGVMLFFRVGEFFEHKAVEKSRGQIMDAIDMRPEVVNLVKDKEIEIIDAQEAEAGQILLVRPGDRIPLDGNVVEGESRIDTSPVTGEPVPVKVQPGSQVISGCINTSGVLKIKVEKVLEESMVTRILDAVENAAASKPRIERFITRFSRVYTPIVVSIAAITAIVPSLITGNWNHWVYTGLTFLVISCPCALVLSVPLSFFSGIGAGSKKGILFKAGSALEALYEVKAIVMDKTGTLTKGNFMVQKIHAVNYMEPDQILSMAASCEQSSTHPIGNSILLAAEEKSLKIESPSAIKEIAGQGIKADVANGQILCGNRKLMENHQVAISGLEQSGSGTEVFVALNGKLAGQIQISDTIKEDAAMAVSGMKKLGIRTAMLTGDQKESAQAVAQEIGIEEVYSKLLPEDKLNRLKEIRKKHGSVMFVGDGINDAPVLAGADVGAAMGAGADAAIVAADVVFMTSNMSAVLQSIQIAKETNKIAKQNVIFALAVKAVVMILGLTGYASMWMAVFADSGVAMLCILNSIRILYKKNRQI
ncbi:heavy metal translocating P-type ATPase [Anaerosacchariphilus polymeriproducens]|uniref:Cd(2+)-exporting ATPase n=1 Tax=Anaerosacchariphilus polymeriproducens TaxID=1812858 RepID=A0A371AUU6_9FIRM|nr:heavy metal translocating P-type ATPase [Anaerosacchariphilus polymeriproducens]RDU23345.1 cadmium-translocating P-type ATPase [Anaerosacchariphilus polymeriproducens]